MIWGQNDAVGVRAEGLRVFQRRAWRSPHDREVEFPPLESRHRFAPVRDSQPDFDVGESVLKQSDEPWGEVLCRRDRTEHDVATPPLRKGFDLAAGMRQNSVDPLSSDDQFLPVISRVEACSICCTLYDWLSYKAL